MSPTRPSSQISLTKALAVQQHNKALISDQPYKDRIVQGLQEALIELEPVTAQGDKSAVAFKSRTRWIMTVGEHAMISVPNATENHHGPNRIEP